MTDWFPELNSGPIKRSPGYRPGEQDEIAAFILRNGAPPRIDSTEQTMQPTLNWKQSRTEAGKRNLKLSSKLRKLKGDAKARGILAEWRTLCGDSKAMPGTTDAAGAKAISALAVAHKLTRDYVRDLLKRAVALEASGE